jgi:hypothetical protein
MRKCGFEIELVAPRGLSRRSLADAIAGDVSGSVEVCFYPQAEPNPQVEASTFETLTLAFRVKDSGGRALCTIADDLTLREDLDKAAPPSRGWYRILCDDVRLERLIARHAKASDPVERVLEPLQHMFGGSIQKLQEGYYRLSDSQGSAICLAAVQPGERERAAEIITTPLSGGHQQALETLLAPARRLGFLLPAEGAVHVHLDAAEFQSAHRMQKLVRLFSEQRENLRMLCKPNPNCRRLGPWPESLLSTVNARDFADIPWPEAVRRMNGTGVKKFCDFNIVNILDGRPDKLTFEVRILAPSTNSDEIVQLAKVLSGLLDEISTVSSHH